MLISRCRKNASRIRGIGVTELVVAAGLLIVVLSVVTTLAVKSGRLRQDSRHYRLAVDELSNQLEFLTALDEESLSSALADLAPSAQIRQALPNPTLSAERLADEYGERLALHLAWDRLGQSRPVTLVSWIDALPDSATADTEEDAP